MCLQVKNIVLLKSKKAKSWEFDISLPSTDVLFNLNITQLQVYKSKPRPNSTLDKPIKTAN